MSEYEQIEQPVTYLMWLFFSLILTSLLILYSGVFSKYITLIYLRSFLSVLTADINYAYSLPQGSKICIPVRYLIKGGLAGITFYQTFDRTWVSVEYVITNPIVRTSSVVRVSAPIFGKFATHYDNISNKYIAVDYLTRNGKGVLVYKSPYSDWYVTSSNYTVGTLMDVSGYATPESDFVIFKGTNGKDLKLKAGDLLIQWSKDVGVPVAICFEKRDGLLVIRDVKSTKYI